MGIDGPPNPPNYYKYYDTPDGEDIDKKMLVTARYGAIAGTIAGTYDVLMYSHAVGLSNVLRRYALHVLPLTAMGAVFAGVANGVQRLRNEDDQLNYFLGGFACGPILAMYLGSGHGVVPGGLALGAAGMVKKLSVDSGVPLIPQHTPHMGTVDGWRKDYSLVKDPKEDEVCKVCLRAAQKVEEGDKTSDGDGAAAAVGDADKDADSKGIEKKKC